MGGFPVDGRRWFGCGSDDWFLGNGLLTGLFNAFQELVSVGKEWW